MGDKDASVIVEKANFWEMWHIFVGIHASFQVLDWHPFIPPTAGGWARLTKPALVEIQQV